jgi:hypothetical protein
METAAYHLHLSPDQAQKAQAIAGDDADAVKWAQLTPENINGLYASHADLVRLAIGA